MSRFPFPPLVLALNRAQVTISLRSSTIAMTQTSFTKKTYKRTIIALAVLASGLCLGFYLFPKLWSTSIVHVDYLSAINARLSDGVTSENNAVCDLVTIFPLRLTDDGKQQFAQGIGLSELPSVSNPLVLADEFFLVDEQWEPSKDDPILLIPVKDDAREQAREECWALFEKFRNQPWRSNEFPQWRSYLDECEGAISIVETASRKPHFYQPVLWEEQRQPRSLIHDLHRGSDQLPPQLRQVVYILQLRAMNSLGEQDPHSAMKDIQTIVRIARLLGSAERDFEQLYAATIETLAFDSLQIILSSGVSIDTNDLSKIRDTLEIREPGTGLPGAVDGPLRLAILDAIQRVATHELKHSEFVPGQPLNESEMSWASFFLTLRINWQATIDETNKFYDECVSIAKDTDSVRRTRRAEVLTETNTTFLVNEKSNPTHSANSTDRGRWFAKVANSLWDPGLAYLVSTDTDCKTRADHQLVAICLELYRAKSGDYPESLQQLVPEFLDRIPADRYTGNALRYRKTTHGFEIYSLGRDQTDQGGKRSEEVGKSPIPGDGNDICFRVNKKSVSEPDGD